MKITIDCNDKYIEKFVKYKNPYKKNVLKTKQRNKV